MKQLALDLADAPKRRWFNVEPDTRPNEWRVVDSETGEVEVERSTKGRAWAWVKAHRS